MTLDDKQRHYWGCICDDLDRAPNNTHAPGHSADIHTAMFGTSEAARNAALQRLVRDPPPPRVSPWLPVMLGLAFVLGFAVGVLG